MQQITKSGSGSRLRAALACLDGYGEIVETCEKLIKASWSEDDRDYVVPSDELLAETLRANIR